MASRVRTLVQSLKGGCGNDSPRLACQAANVARRAGAVVREEWPGIKIKAKDAYQTWKNTVNAGDEFVTLCHKTGKLFICVAAPGVVLKIAYMEYKRNPEEIDKGSRYEKTRETALACLHYADPELAKLWVFVSSGFKTPEQVARDEEIEKLRNEMLARDKEIADLRERDKEMADLRERFALVDRFKQWKIKMERGEHKGIDAPGEDEVGNEAGAKQQTGEAGTVQGEVAGVSKPEMRGTIEDKVDDQARPPPGGV